MECLGRNNSALVNHRYKYVNHTDARNYASTHNYTHTHTNTHHTNTYTYTHTHTLELLRGRQRVYGYSVGGLAGFALYSTALPRQRHVCQHIWVV